MKEQRIDVAADFARSPGGRYRADGPHSGEQFREELLRPALDSAQVVVVELGGANGFLGSFLEEVFGGIVRDLGPQAADRITINSTGHPGRRLRALRYMQDAIKASKDEAR